MGSDNGEHKSPFKRLRSQPFLILFLIWITIFAVVLAATLCFTWQTSSDDATIRQDSKSLLRTEQHFTGADTKLQSLPAIRGITKDESNHREEEEEEEEEEEDPFWIDYGISDIREHYKCSKIFSKERPVHSEETWMHLRQVYQRIVGKEASTVGDVLSTQDAFNGMQHHGAQSPGMGRGIFSDQFIPKGTLVYEFSRSAQFTSGKDYTQFNMEIAPDLSCDVLQWAYVQDLNYTNEVENQDYYDLRIVVDLDEGSFCNNGGSNKGNIGYINDDSEMNIDQWNNQLRPLYATKDIHPGDEILCKYGEFSNGDWSSFF